MAKYVVTYEDKSGDISHVWVNASSEDDAEMQARDEYWDIKRIVDVYKK